MAPLTEEALGQMQQAFDKDEQVIVLFRDLDMQILFNAQGAGISSQTLRLTQI